MTSQSIDPDAALFAALAAGVYRTSDAPLTLDGINALFGTRYDGVSPDDLSPMPVMGMDVAVGVNTHQYFYYANDGFVASVVKDEVADKYVVVFRGTDSAASITTALLVGVLQATNLLNALPSWLHAKLQAVTDENDVETNTLLGYGSSGPNIGTSGIQGPGQLGDALALTQAVIAAAGGDASKVTVVGQSLGGGIAGLVSAFLNVKSYLFDPAPFDNQILWQSYVDAKAVVDALFPAIASDNVTLSPGSLWHAPGANVKDPNSVAIFQQAQADIYANYEQQLNQNATAYLIRGEMISAHDSNLTAFGINEASSSAFSSIIPVPVDDGAGDALSLHSPYLIALTLKTANGDTPFSVMTSSDAAIRNALFGAPTFGGTALQIVGPTEHPRADPAGNLMLTNGLQGGFSTSSLCLGSEY